MGHVTSPEKMHRGAIAPHWIITAWIGIPSSGAFPRPGARAWACQPAHMTATPAPGMGAGPPARAHICGRDPGRRPGQDSQRARTQPPRQARARALRPARRYVASTLGAGLGKPANVHIRDPEPGARACRPACTGTPLGPARKGGEENNGACHLPRRGPGHAA